MINLSSVLKNSRFTKTVMLIRDDSRTEIIASITPASSVDLQKLPEGERFTPVFNVFSETELKVNDLIEFHNHQYVITHCEDWAENGYYYATAIRLIATDKKHSTGFRVT